MGNDSVFIGGIISVVGVCFHRKVNDHPETERIWKDFVNINITVHGTPPYDK